MSRKPKKPSQRDIENAFIPNREVVDQQRFAGRKSQVERAYLALLGAGSNVAILGPRGLGKSSLARQLINISKGETALLDRLSIPYDRPLNFRSFYHACGNSIAGTDHLLERLLTMSDCLAGSCYDVPKARKILEAYNPRFEAKVFGTGVSLGANKSEEVTRESVAPRADVTSIFTNVVAAILETSSADQGGDGLLFVIDEFDQIRQKVGFASFLKSLATNVPQVRFAIVGVAHDLQELMSDHRSADRLFAGAVIPIPHMTGAELTEIIDMAQVQIGDHILYHNDAKRRLVQLAQGHPYMIHLLGKLSLRTAWQKSKIVVEVEDVEATLRSIAAAGADPVLEARYTTAIGASALRETVLKAMAEVEKNGEVFTGEAYQLSVQRGVDNPSQCVGQLVTDEHGAELIKVRDRYYRFKDSLFRAYVLVRPPHYNGDGGVNGVH
jgi:Cdc6-like AAA superfamily ATPase